VPEWHMAIRPTLGRQHRLKFARVRRRLVRLALRFTM